MSRRVVVTGIGLVSSLGIGTEATWKGLLDGRSGAGPITKFDASAFSTRFAAEVKGFDPLAFIDKKDVKKMDVFIQYAVAASQYAMDDARLVITPENAPRVGVYIASGIGGFTTIEREHRAFLEGGPRRISPFFIPSAIINLASGQVSIRFGAKGPNSATCTACTASAHALGDAFEIIKRGAADAMIAGGSEAAVCAMGVGGFAAMRALSQRNDEPERASRPFDKDRDGFVLGEGAGVLILEELEHARGRGAPIYAEMVGYGMSGDAFHMTGQPEDGDGAYRAMRPPSSRRASGPTSSTTSTPTAPPPRSTIRPRPWRSSGVRRPRPRAGDVLHQSMTGHLLGAAGGLEAGITALAVHHQVLPPTINLDEPGEDATSTTCRRSPARRPSSALSNSFGFRAPTAPCCSEVLMKMPSASNRSDPRVAAPAERQPDLDPRAGCQLRMNEPDAYALEEAAPAEKHGGEVVVCSAGPTRVQQVIREALARGRSGAARRGRRSRRGRRLHGGGGAGAGDEGGGIRPHSDRAAVRRPGPCPVRSGPRREAGRAALHDHHGGAGQPRSAVDEGQARARRRVVPVRHHAAAGAAHHPERHQPAALRHAQGHHGGEEEGDPRWRRPPAWPRA